MEVKLSRGLFARQRRERERRERNKGSGINELLSNKSDTVNVLAPYKMQPEILPFTGDKRLIPRSCRDCVKANRWDESRRDDDAELGIGNCFLLSNRNRSKPLQRRLFAEILHFWDCGGQLKLFKGFVTADDLLNYPKFKDQMLKVLNCKVDERIKLHGTVPNELISGASGSDFKTVIINGKELTLEKFIEAFGVRQVKDWLHRLFIRFGGWMLSKIFNTIFDGVCYHKGTMKLLKTVTTSGLPIIYVPLYKSSLDPVLLPWVLLTLGVSPLPFVLEPRTVAQTPWLRSFSSIFGGFGIRRIAHNRSGYSKLGRLAAFSYTRLSILNGNSLQFVIEPHRSRSGKPSPFLTGSDILSTIVDMHKHKELEDAFIVPVSISYEKLPEQEILECAQTEPTKCQAAGLLSLAKLLTRSLGFVRVDLSQPIRLNDCRFRRPYSTSIPYDPLDIPFDPRSTWMIPPREFQFDPEAGSVASLSSLYAEYDPFCVKEDDPDKVFSDMLAEHVLWDAQKASAFMSTNLLSFLLLKKFRNGTTLDNLIKEMVQLRTDIYSKKRDVGFTGDMPAVVSRAIELLGKSIISMSRNKDGQVRVKPTGTTKSSLVLGYYAGPLVQLYIREACISTAILSIAGLSYKAMLNTSFPLSTSEEQLVHDSLEVAQLMKGEFILNPPCQTTDSVIRQAIDDLNDYSYIQIHKKKEYLRTGEFDDSGDDYDEYDDGTLNIPVFSLRSDVAIRVEKIEFINNEETWKYHEFLRSLVVPYLEFYRVGLNLLLRLGSGEMEEVELRQKILQESKNLLATSKLFNAEEIITIDTARNFLYHMTSMQIIGSWSDDKTNGKRMYYLTDDYAGPQEMEVVIARVMQYITY